MALNPDRPFYLPTDGGVAATHPEVPVPPGVVGPATENQLNTFRARLIPFACWKVDNIRFDYNSSFVKPEIVRELETLKQLRARHPGAVLSIFGHTDPPSPGQPAARQQRYKLHIRRTDSIWPVKMAEICTGNANRYKELEPIEENKKFLTPNGQWRDLYAENEIFLPTEWQQEKGWEKLCHDYDIRHVEENGLSAAPTWADEDCKAISGRRAAAIYALLTRRTDIWEDIYSNGGKYTSAMKGDRWGAAALQTMLATLGREEVTAPWEQSAGKRNELFRAYMDKLCGSTSKQYKLVIQPDDSIWPTKLAKICTGDENRYKELEPYNKHLMHGPGQWRDLCAKDEIVMPPTWTPEECRRARDDKGYTVEESGNDSERSKELLLKKDDFLARGRDPHGKGDYQGCGGFNPIIRSGQMQETEPGAEQPVTEEAANRRVMVLIFRSGSRVEPVHWPCPSVKDKADGCRKRLWFDANQRLVSAEQHREFMVTRDTFACRFYDRLVNRSPCEVRRRTLNIRLTDSAGHILADEPYTLAIENMMLCGQTTPLGSLHHLIPGNARRGTLRCRDWCFELSIADLAPANDEPGALQRLHNMAYCSLTASERDPSDAGAVDPERLLSGALRSFQTRRGLQQSGELDALTVESLKEAYGC